VDGLRSDFEEVFLADYARVVRVVAPIVGSVEDAEAVAQEAFLKAFTRWRRIGGYDQPGAWVRRVAIRDAVRLAERNRRPVPEPSPGADPADTAAKNVDLVRLLQDLPPRQRACVVLYHLASWSTAEVAESLGCSAATVRVHLHRAKSTLAAALGEREEVTDER
jgi:RNA polymerase sigma-70 factor (ECF subfamily)